MRFHLVEVQPPVKEVKVFLAGGISGCPDWQKELISKIGINLPPTDAGLVTLYNPRRKDFNVKDPKMSAQQIEWEASNLDSADIISFWFPHETVCPITLFELGKYAMTDKRIVVGCHPKYTRLFDIKHQLKQIKEREHTTVASSLEDLSYLLCREIRELLCSQRKS